ncbi:ATP-binding protein [Halovenus salina]|uniref:ATP-binding protein n=1 Tax=Halovenus salina TaxID=1510225 RepID=A0ABD5W6P0_9EURY
MTAATSKTSPTAHITKTEFWNTLMEDVFGIRKGGAIIFLDAENARKGVAKTSGAVALARLFARAFRYDIQFEDLTLSGTEYLRRYQEHPGQEQPSVLVLDEFVGAGAGDKRRAMAQQNVDFGRAWQLLRTKRVITIATLPDWNEADKRLKKLADYRIWCRERPIGTFQPYKITVPFNADGSGGVRTKGLNRTGDGARRIQFPNMDAQNDPYYTHLSEKKDELIHSETWDADHLHDEESAETSDPEEVRRSEAIRYAIRLYEPWNDENDTTYTDVAKVVEGYQKSWVGDRVKEWREESTGSCA